MEATTSVVVDKGRTEVREKEGYCTAKVPRRQYFSWIPCTSVELSVSKIVFRVLSGTEGPTPSSVNEEEKIRGCDL